MKADVERRERAQATIIDNQAKRLEELDNLYKVRHAPMLCWRWGRDGVLEDDNGWTVAHHRGVRQIVGSAC